MLGHVVKTLAYGAALTGGLVLVALVALTTLSVAGRGFSQLGYSAWGQDWLGLLGEALVASGIDEIKGIYELTEAGIAFAVFAFLPLCQLTGGHARVDLVTSLIGGRATRWLTAFWEAVLAVTILLLTERLFVGLMRYFGNGETTFFLQFPLWWAYGAAFVAACIACVIALYCLWARILEAVTGRPVLPRWTA